MLVTLLNLRGIRESGSIFAVPTYLFLVGIFGMIALGLVRSAHRTGSWSQTAGDGRRRDRTGTQTVGILLILTAFSPAARR